MVLDFGELKSTFCKILINYKYECAINELAVKLIKEDSLN